MPMPGSSSCRLTMLPIVMPPYCHAFSRSNYQLVAQSDEEKYESTPITPIEPHEDPKVAYTQ